MTDGDIFLRAFEAATDIYGEMIPQREYRFKSLFALANVAMGGCIVEIGAYHGFGTIALMAGSLENPSKPIVYSVDRFTSSKGWIGESYSPDDLGILVSNFARVNNYFDNNLILHLIIGEARNVGQHWKDRPDGHPDVSLLVWDCGTKDTIESDLEPWLGCISMFGFLAAHDTSDGKLGCEMYMKKLMAKGGWEKYEKLPGDVHTIRKSFFQKPLFENL